VDLHGRPVRRRAGGVTVAKTASLAMPNGVVYFFNGLDYVRHDATTGVTAPGYPKPIGGNWPGLAEVGFDDGIDAAVAWPNGKVYFFSGSEYVRYDVTANTVDAGYPMEISAGWAGLFDKDIDAAVVWPNGKAYFFRGNDYVRYDLAANAVDPGYPRSIASAWPGVFVGDIDSASILPDGAAYFVSGGHYVRYDVAADRAADGYPQPLGAGFPNAFGGVTPPPTTGLSPLRQLAVDLVTSVVPSDHGDPAFADLAADWTGGGTTCGFLCHWLLYRLGCTDATLVNREAPDRGLSYVDGRNIAKLYHGGATPFVRWTPGASPQAGDIVFIRGDGNPTEHVFVYLSEEFTADGTVWNTAEAGQTNEHGHQCARLKRRRPLVGSGALRVSGNTPERTIIGWVDLDLLGPDLLGPDLLGPAL